MRPGREHLRQDLVALCHQGLDVPGFFGRAQQVLGRFVGFDGCCWLTFDPATILPTGHIPYRSIPPEQVPRAVENEYAEEDVDKFAVLARELRHVGVLSQATGGAARPQHPLPGRAGPQRVRERAARGVRAGRVVLGRRGLVPHAEQARLHPRGGGRRRGGWPAR
jgi:hypothetical protein